MSKPSISVVVNTYNRAQVLSSCLTALLHQKYDDFEIIVVNGPSTDRTSDVLYHFKDLIKSASCSDVNLSISRNIGISCSAGDIVAFIDDDAVAHPEWLARLAVRYADPRIGGVGGFTLDHTGITFQARRTICDRAGNAFFVSDFFNEVNLCIPQSPFFPSLLGTNSSFRKSALIEIGGFDHAFSYFLDETDVCARLVDFGHYVVYEPSAIVFHQYAESHLRDQRRIAKNLYPSAFSKSYFVYRHLLPFDCGAAATELVKYKEELQVSNRWFHENGLMTDRQKSMLDHEVAAGLTHGAQQATHGPLPSLGNLASIAKLEVAAALKRVPRCDKLRLCFISQSYPPRDEAGIARWTALVAKGLAERGHEIHIVTRADATGEAISYKNGIWMHEVAPLHGQPAADLALQLDLPPEIAAWNARVRQEVEKIKGFGLDALSFPIWDLEAFACLGDPDILVAMSLHTTYALAVPFKPEWTLRPLYRAFMVDKMIEGEKEALRRADLIVANSKAVCRDLESIYNLTLPETTRVVPHGTASLSDHATDVGYRPTGRRERPLRVLFVGRNEIRKGIDIAFETVKLCLANSLDCEFWFVGANAGDLRQEAESLDAGILLKSERVRFLGILPNSELETAFRDCDVVIVPSRYESFGLVAIEALAASKPAIVAEVGGLAEIVENGKNGYLVSKTGGAAEYAKRIMMIATNQDLYASLVEGARESYEKNYTTAIMCAKLEAAFIEGIARKRRNES